MSTHAVASPAQRRRSDRRGRPRAGGGGRSARSRCRPRGGGRRGRAAAGTGARCRCGRTRSRPGRTGACSPSVSAAHGGAAHVRVEDAPAGRRWHLRTRRRGARPRRSATQLRLLAVGVAGRRPCPSPSRAPRTGGSAGSRRRAARAGSRSGRLRHATEDAAHAWKSKAFRGGEILPPLPSCSHGCEPHRIWWARPRKLCAARAARRRRAQPPPRAPGARRSPGCAPTASALVVSDDDHAPQPGRLRARRAGAGTTCRWPATTRRPRRSRSCWRCCARSCAARARSPSTATRDGLRGGRVRGAPARDARRGPGRGARARRPRRDWRSPRRPGSWWAQPRRPDRPPLAEDQRGEVLRDRHGLRLAAVHVLAAGLAGQDERDVQLRARRRRRCRRPSGRRRPACGRRRGGRSR